MIGMEITVIIRTRFIAFSKPASGSSAESVRLAKDGSSLRMIVRMAITNRTRPSGFRPARRDNSYSREPGISAFQLFTPDFWNSFHRSAAYSMKITSKNQFPRTRIRRWKEKSRKSADVSAN